MMSIITQHEKLEEYSRAEWGPVFWYMLHRLSESFKPEYSTYYYNYISQYPLLIPCPICSYHFGEMLKTNPPRTDSVDNLFEWGVKVHNTVNRRLNKDQVSIEKARDLYSKRIDHRKVIRFLKYLSEFLAIDPNIYRINATVITLTAITYINPCCRKQMVGLNERESLDTKNIQQYIQKMINILNEC